ncbi:MAG: branched-chain-amino-acid transaminase [Chthoniobacterales bacterium]
MQIYIDGTFFSEAEAKISVFDHGLLYGDGIFEGIRFYKRIPFYLEEHLTRLFQSAKALLLNIPLDREALKKAVLETIQKNEFQDGYIRLLVTRGKGSLGLNPDSCPHSSLIIIADKVRFYSQELYEKGISIITCATRRIGHGALSPRIKSLNYLNNVFAKQEALRAGVDDGLMLNEEGLVAECTGANIFIVVQGELLTPSLECGALAGITRALVIKLAKELEITIKEIPLTCYDLYTAEECFLTGTAVEIIPVTHLDQRVIGDGISRSITRQLMEKFHKLTQ